MQQILSRKTGFCEHIFNFEKLILSQIDVVQTTQTFFKN